MSPTPIVEGALPEGRRRVVRLIARLLIAFAAAVTAVGIADAWIRDRDGDMGKREAEYRLYRDGIYPDPGIEPVPPGRKPLFSVYPPWAIPLFTLFFEPGGRLQGRLAIEMLSVASLVTMGAYGWKRLRPFGLEAGTLGAAAGAAIAGNASAFSLGQFSIICMGLVAAEMLLLEKRRPVAAGCCWAMSMLKPQIGIAFTPLLLLRGNRLGFVAGAAVLVGLSLLACAWTEIPPWDLAERWLLKNRLEFNGHGVFQERLHAWTGLSQRSLVAIGMATLAVVAGMLVIRCGSATDVDVLRFTAPLAVIGMLAVYHRHYDNVMLWPTLLAAIERAFRIGHRADLAVAAALWGTLLVHDRWVSMVPFGHLASGAVWVFAAARLLRRDVPSRRTPGGAT